MGGIAFAMLLLWFREADFDVWHQLAIGAHWWHTGEINEREVFSFLPTLPKVINHEWGAGIWNYLLMRLGGSPALMLWKIAAGLGTLAAALYTARRAGASHGALLAFAPIAAFCVLPGFVPVVRAHVFTYLGFAILLALVEFTRRRRVWWPVPTAIAVMLVWANCHGGFVAGFGLLGVYTLAAFRDRELFIRLAVMSAGCAAVTFINPWGWEYWPHHLMAITHARPDIPEWKPIAYEGFTPFVGYWLMLATGIVVLAAGLRGVKQHNWPALIMFAITLALPFTARRHVPFCGIMGAVALAPYLAYLAGKTTPFFEKRSLSPSTLGLIGNGILLLIAMGAIAPSARFNVRAPIGLFPVRECDVLDRAQISGNLAVPFGWGCYSMWRLHPKIKTSMDGRYEAAYPESSFQMNQAFFNLSSPDWARMVEEYRVDFVILDLSTGGLAPRHLEALGFSSVYLDKGTSALFVRNDRMAELRGRLAGVDLASMPTVEPFDPAIAARWFPAEGN